MSSFYQYKDNKSFNRNPEDGRQNFGDKSIIG